MREVLISEPRSHTFCHRHSTRQAPCWVSISPALLIRLSCSLGTLSVSRFILNYVYVYVWVYAQEYRCSWRSGYRVTSDYEPTIVGARNQIEIPSKRSMHGS